MRVLFAIVIILISAVVTRIIGKYLSTSAVHSIGREQKMKKNYSSTSNQPIEDVEWRKI